MTFLGNDHIAGALAETQEFVRMLVKQLQAHSATAIGFVNEVKLNVQGERDARADLLGEWLNASLLLGNYGYGHLKFGVVRLPAYEEQFLRGDSITRELLAEHHLKERYFRLPYIDTGNSEDKRSNLKLCWRIATTVLHRSRWRTTTGCLMHRTMKRGDRAINT
jgi:hypothetical protein